MVYMSVGDSHHNQGNHGESSAFKAGMTVTRVNEFGWFCTCWAHLQVGPR